MVFGSCWMTGHMAGALWQRVMSVHPLVNHMLVLLAGCHLVTRFHQMAEQVLKRVSRPFLPLLKIKLVRAICIHLGRWQMIWLLFSVQLSSYFSFRANPWFVLILGNTDLRKFCQIYVRTQETQLNISYMQLVHCWVPQNSCKSNLKLKQSSFTALRAHRMHIV